MIRDIAVNFLLIYEKQKHKRGNVKKRRVCD